jgi:hypothetical protein
VETALLESDITRELDKLMSLTVSMIKGKPAKMIELTSITEGDSEADIATLLVGDDIFYFVDLKSENPLEDYIELRSSKFPQMAITLPRPLFTRIKEQGWRGDLC